MPAQARAVVVAFLLRGRRAPLLLEHQQERDGKPLTRLRRLRRRLATAVTSRARGGGRTPSSGEGTVGLAFPAAGARAPPPRACVSLPRLRDPRHRVVRCPAGRLGLTAQARPRCRAWHRQYAAGEQARPPPGACRPTATAVLARTRQGAALPVPSSRR
jgi:hypothetical protein